MKSKKIIQYMELIDDKFILEAAPENAENINKRKNRTSLILRYGALAASFVLIVGVLVTASRMQHDDTIDPVLPKDTIINTQETTDPIKDSSDSTDIPNPPVTFNVDECQQMFDGFNKAIGGGSTFLIMEYMEETYNVAYLGAVTRQENGVVSQEELDRWVNEVYLQQNIEAQNELPTLYQAIRDLCVSKEEFVALNDGRKAEDSSMALSDEIVDALFLSEDEMKKVLVHPCALYYEGNIYTWTELSKTSVEDIINQGIPGEVLQSYVDNLVRYCVANGFISESHISRYFGTEK